MVSFVVPGRPVPAARMTQRGKWTSRARRSLAYQEAVAWAAKAAGVPVLSGPVCLTARFYLCGQRRGDLSNYLKAVEDGLQYAGVIPNDRQIVAYGGGTGIYPAANRKDERAEIVLSELPEAIPWLPAEAEDERYAEAQAFYDGDDY
ncbi:MAG: RusA family crossover junction endodeoxyribonuclease [Clostridia bacterium]|nr:RusA family crossover junction endodeoxyribonuclease [Clostridia bacterium]